MISDAPKLFYTPEEIDIREGLEYITLAFRGLWDLNDNSLSIVNIKYIKVELRNTEHDYVYVMKDCVDVFLGLYDLIE